MGDPRVEMLKEKLDSILLSDYHGLTSPGLTCYLNSVLQALFMTPDFRDAIKRCCRVDSLTFSTQLARLFSDLERHTAGTHDIVEGLGITDVYKQRDAAEYLEKILSLTNPEASKIFKGELRHKTTCLQCSDSRESSSCFWILPLVVEDSRSETDTVAKGLETFFKQERVSGDNKMYCSRCKRKEEANLECEIIHNPEILTLMLKRFSCDPEGNRYVKLHCNVEVPQTLVQKEDTYDLYAVIHHFGNLMGGHYTAHIKSFETLEWYHFNDRAVEIVRNPLFNDDRKTLMSCTAYLLMYRKVSKLPESEAAGRCAVVASAEAPPGEHFCTGEKDLKYKDVQSKRSYSRHYLLQSEDTRGTPGGQSGTHCLECVFAPHCKSPKQPKDIVVDRMRSTTARGSLIRDNTVEASAVNKRREADGRAGGKSPPVSSRERPPSSHRVQAYSPGLYTTTISEDDDWKRKEPQSLTRKKRTEHQRRGINVSKTKKQVKREPWR